MALHSMRPLRRLLAASAAAAFAGPVAQTAATLARPFVQLEDEEAAAPTTLVFEIRCGDEPAKRGEVRVEGPDGEVVIAPISQDGRACFPGLAQGWACVREVRAGTGEGAEPGAWCLDPALHLNGAVQLVTLNLSPAFSIRQFGPRLPHTHASGTATLVRTAGAQGAYVVDECDVADLFGQIDFPGLRSGNYRVILPWRKDWYLSIADQRLDGTPRRLGHLDFRTVVVPQEDAGKRPAQEGDWLGASGRTLRGTLLGERGAPLPGGVLMLVRSNLRGPRVLQGRGIAAVGDTIEALCDGNGEYVIRGLREGRYLVSARPHGAHGTGHRDGSPAMMLESVRFDGGRGGEGSLEASPIPAPVAMLEGFVDGEIPAGLRVIATPGSAFGSLEAAVFEDGSFSFGEVPLDDYWLDLPGGERAMGLCLAAPRAAVAGGEPIELVPRTATRLAVVAPFPEARPSEGWFRITQDDGATELGPSRRMIPQRKVQWSGIGTEVIDGLPPGRFRVTFSETRDSAGSRIPRFAAGWIDLPQVTLAQASMQLQAVTGRSLRLLNRNQDHSIHVAIRDSEGVLFEVEVPSGSDRSVTIPEQEGTLAPPLEAVIREAFGADTLALTIPKGELFLHVSRK